MDTFLGCWYTISNKSEFLVCLSVCLFAYFHTEITQMQGYLQFWMRYLSGIFWDLPEVLVHCIQKNQISFYVCQSGSWHTSLMKSDKFRDIASSGWDIFLNLYGHIPGMLVHLFQIILNFLYVCHSGSLHTSLRNPTNSGILPVLDEISFWIYMDTFLGCWYNCSK